MNSFALLISYLTLTYLVWGIFVFERGISPLDEPNIIQYILSAQDSLLSQLFVSVAPPGRFFMLTPYTLSIWSGYPVVVLQLLYGFAWLGTGLLAYGITLLMFAEKRMAYLAGALTLTATGDYFTNYLGVLGGYLAVTYYFACLFCLLFWWIKCGSVAWLIGSALLLLLSIWTTEYAITSIILTPILLWALDRFRISKRLLITMSWWYSFSFISIAVLLTGILRPGDHRNDVLFNSISIEERVRQTLNFFLYNFTPHRWVFRSIPDWFTGYAPVISEQMRIIAVVIGVLVFLVVARVMFHSNTFPVFIGDRFRYVALGAILLVMTLFSNAAMSSMGSDYFVRSHLVSRVWASIVIALGSYVVGMRIVKKPYVIFIVPTVFIGAGIYSGIERQDYQIGIWKRHQIELRSIVDQVPGVKPDTMILLLVPPGAHPLLATSNINYLPALYGDPTLQQRVFYWGSTWQYYSRCTATAEGFLCQMFSETLCGSGGACAPRLLPYNKLIFLVYSVTRNQFVLQERIPSGILQGVEISQSEYNVAARMNPRSLPAYTYSLLYSESALAIKLPNTPEPHFRQRPILQVDNNLVDAVQADIIDPWRSEQSNGKTVVWLGPGQGYGLEGWIWSDNIRAVALRLHVAAGPSREDLIRTLQFKLMHSTETTVQYQTFASPSHFEPVEVTFNVMLKPGRNDFIITVLDKVTVQQLPNGDSRPLLVLLSGIIVSDTITASK